MRIAPSAANIVMVVSLAGFPLGLVAQGGEGEVGIPLGTFVESVQIEDLDGNPVDLADIIGSKPALFEFWATWCPLCKALEPQMVAAHERYGDRIAIVPVAVAVNQSKRTIRRHLERHPLPFTFLYDTRGRATRAFAAPTTSYVVALDATGKVVYTGVGVDQDIEQAVQAALGHPK